jgi:predicted transcriptional regulator of viral defense system/very-short-patch-repair endonuclease
MVCAFCAAKWSWGSHFAAQNVRPHRHDAVMTERGWGRVVGCAGRQHGLVTGAQVNTAGVTRGALRTRVASGELENAAPGVYRFCSAPRTWEQRALAALMRLGPQAALSHGSAAHVLKLDGFHRTPTNVDVLVAKDSGVKTTNWCTERSVVLHHTRTAFESRVVNGLRVTDLARTVMDLAGQVDGERLEDALDAAQRRNPGLEGVLSRKLKRSCKGVTGSAQLAGLLEERGGEHTDSALEAKVFRALRKARVRRPEHQHEVFDGERYVVRLDFAWVREKVALHVDGYTYHQQRTRFEHDRGVATQLTALGWRSVWVTSRSLGGHDWVKAVKAALRDADPQLTLFKRAN